MDVGTGKFWDAARVVIGPVGAPVAGFGQVKTTGAAVTSQAPTAVPFVAVTVNGTDVPHSTCASAGGIEMSAFRLLTEQPGGFWWACAVPAVRATAATVPATRRHPTVRREVVRM